MLEQFEHELVAFTKWLSGIDNQQHQVALFQGAVYFPHHATAQRGVRLVHSRSVDEHNLSWGPPVTSFYIYKTLNAMPRGLGLVRDNGHLLAYERVEKRGLSRIGSADDGDESGTECHKGLRRSRDRMRCGCIREEPFSLYLRDYLSGPRQQCSDSPINPESQVHGRYNGSLGTLRCHKVACKGETSRGDLLSSRCLRELSHRRTWQKRKTVWPILFV